MTDSNGNTEREDAEAIRKRALMTIVTNVSANDTREIANLSERADAVLRHSDGLSSDDLQESVPESLRPDLESAVYEAFESRSKETGLRADVNDVPTRLDVTVEALESYRRGDAHVHFTESGGSSGRKDSNDRLRAAPVSETEGWVQAELECTREQLQTHVETYEEAMEEMERVNKELLAVKKELQPKNEELETLRDEQKSLNESLKAANQELRLKNAELREANTDLANVMATSEIATLFVTQDLEIKRFTPQTAELFNIAEPDVRWKLGDFLHRFVDDGLLEDVREVLDAHLPIEREIRAVGDRWFLARLQPSRTAEGEDEGVVISFVDITGRKKGERVSVEKAELAAFRADLINAIGRLADPVEIQDEAARVLGEWLDVERTYYAEVLDDRTTIRIYADHCSDDAESLIGEHDLEYGGTFDLLRAGESEIVDDYRATSGLSDEELGMPEPADIAAWVGVPVLKGGELSAFMAVTESDPREWRDVEVRMAEEAVERMRVAVEDARAEKDRREREAELAAELEATRELQKFSTQLIGGGDVDTLSQHVLDAAVAILDADFASFQLYDPDQRELALLAHRGFRAAAESVWARVTPEYDCTCAKALEAGERVVVPDIESCDFMVGTEDLETFRQMGIRAVQTTPLVSRKGVLLGMLSTHWTSTTDLDERDLNRLDVLARQAADLIDHQQRTDVLRESRARLDAFVTATSEEVFRMSSDWSEILYLGGNEYIADTGESRQSCFENCIPDNEKERVAAGIEKAIANKKPFEMEHQVALPDGTVGWVRSRAVPVLDHDGDIIEWFGSATDITERRELQQAVVDAAEDVRREIAQDLHDVLSSDLAAATMKTGYLKDQLEQQGLEEAEELEKILEMVRESANQARTLSHNLMPVAVREESLAAGLTNLCWEEEDLSHLTCSFDGDRNESLPTDDGTAMHLYRIAREATVNARRHAQANVVKMSLRRRDAALVLTVWDDGIGIPKADEREAGLGLRTMRYRADVMGASLTVEPGEEGGTVVCCALPLSEAKGD